MTSKEFKAVFAQLLQQHGFAKERNLFYKRADQVICVLSLQKSNFEDCFYVNVGYVLKEIHPNSITPRETEGDIRTRFIVRRDGKEEDRFDPSGFASEDELREVVRNNLAELVDDCLSIEGVQSLLASRPSLMYQTTLVARKLLGCS